MVRNESVSMIKDQNSTMKQHLIKWAKISRNALNDHILAPLDVLGTSPRDGDYAPVFILGAPRCGSTLLSQLITQCLDVAYFSNFHAQLYGSPAFAEKLRALNPQRYQSDFASRHGVTNGWSAPSENAAFWYRFFRRKPAFVPLSDMPDHQGQAFERSIERFSAASDKSVVIKNLYAALRLEVIQHYLPKAKFIVLKRDVRDNAISILNSRQKINGNYHQWWSVDPPERDQLQHLHPVDQVLGQISAIYELIEAAKHRTTDSQNTFLELQYETLCEQPKDSLTSICDFIPGCRLRPNSIQTLPTQFQRTQRDVDDQELRSELSRQLDTAP